MGKITRFIPRQISDKEDADQLGKNIDEIDLDKLNESERERCKKVVKESVKEQVIAQVDDTLSAFENTEFDEISIQSFNEELEDWNKGRKNKEDGLTIASSKGQFRVQLKDGKWKVSKYMTGSLSKERSCKKLKEYSDEDFDTQLKDCKDDLVSDLTVLHDFLKASKEDKKKMIEF